MPSISSLMRWVRVSFTSSSWLCIVLSVKNNKNDGTVTQLILVSDTLVEALY